MKILAVIGSPKGKGNTYRVVTRIEEKMKKLDAGVEFEYIMLKDVNLQACKGCFMCLSKGEALCPIKDEQSGIMKKMDECDGMILASPVYAYSLSWIAKSFIDRYAYICHRPRYHGKKALAVSTTGAVGLGATLKQLGMPLAFWGFEVVGKLGIITPPEMKPGDEAAGKQGRKIEAAAEAFYKATASRSLKKPGLFSVIGFQMQKYAFGNAAKDSADYIYWEDKGWLDKKSYYYCPARIGFLKRGIARLLTKIIINQTMKPFAKEADHAST